MHRSSARFPSTGFRLPFVLESPEMFQRVVRRLRLVSVLASALFIALPASPQLLGTRFTYQGYLEDGGVPKNGDIDLAVNAFDAASGGAVIGFAKLESVPVSNGVFTVQLDFGNSTFLGTTVFLDMHVREDADGDMASNDNFVQLSPRQELTPTPYALHAESVSMDAISSAEIADGSITASDVDTTSTSVGLQRRLAGSCSTGSALSDISASGAPSCTPVIQSVVGINGISAATSQGQVTLSLDSATAQQPIQGRCVPVGDAAVSHINPDGSVACTYLTSPSAQSPTAVDTATTPGAHLSAFPAKSSSNFAAPAVAFYDAAQKELLLSVQGGATQVIDTAGDVGQFVSLRVINRRLVMAYYDASGGNLKLAACQFNDLDCSSGVELVRTLDAVGDVGRHAELLDQRAASSSTTGLLDVGVAYYDASNNRYKFARCTNADCSTAGNVILNGLVPPNLNDADIAADRRAIPIATNASFAVALESNQVALIRCQDRACSSFVKADIAAPSVGSNQGKRPISMATRYDAAGNAFKHWVGYVNQNGSYFAQYCEDAACSSGNRRLIRVRNSIATNFSVQAVLMPSLQPLFVLASSTGVSLHPVLDANPRPDVGEDLGENATALPANVQALDMAAPLGDRPGFTMASLVYLDPSDGEIKRLGCRRQDCSEH